MKFSPVTPCLTSDAITKLPSFINSVVSTYNKENFDLSRYTNFNFLHPRVRDIHVFIIMA